MKLENLSEFMTYMEAKERWVKKPNNSNAGFALASSFRLIDQAFVKQSKEELKEYEPAKKKLPVGDDDRDNITIEAYLEWLKEIDSICHKSIKDYNNIKNQLYENDEPYVKLYAVGLRDREIPTDIFLKLIHVEMDIINAALKPKRTWRDHFGDKFEYAFQLRIANPALIEAAEFAMKHKDKGEENGN